MLHRTLIKKQAKSARTKTERHYGRLCAALLCAGVIVSASTAHSFELFGYRLFGSKEPEAEDFIGDPQPYDVMVTTGDGEKDTENLVKGASQLWESREKPASGVAGLVARAKGDYRRILDALYAEAHYGGVISITIDGREANDLAPDAALSPSASVHINVDPGPAFHFSHTRIINPAPMATWRGDQVEDPAKIGFQTGELARSGIILSAGALAREAWRQQGYAKATISQREVIAEHANNTIDATLTVDPGRKATFGSVTLSGTERMDPTFVKRQTGLVEGMEYDPDDIKKASENLARLEVFRSTRIQEAEHINDDGTLPVDIIVQERPLRRLGAGGTYSTLDGLGLEAYWMHRNLFGKAERLRIEGKVAGIGETIDPAKFTYRLGTTFIKPGVFTPYTDFSANLFGDREVLDSYTRTGVSSQAGFNHRFNDNLTGAMFITGSHARFDDAFGTREFTTAGLLGSLTYDGRDNAADATEGFYAEITAEPFYEFNYGNPAGRMTLDTRAYYSFDENNRFVIAGRLKTGMLLDPPIEQMPADKLFLAGGGGSVRGYSYRSIGVDTPAGVVGGRSLIEGSAELRIRMTDTIGVVGFVDAGYVGADALPKFSEDLRIGVGAGLRYLTPFGPVRLDLATPLDKRKGDSAVALYVGIGQAF